MNRSLNANSYQRSRFYDIFVTFLGRAALSIGIRKSKQNSDALVEATIDKKVLIS